MGTLLKYIFYLVLIVVIYLVGRGIYEGSINEETTVGSVVDQVGEGSQRLAKDTVNAVENVADKATQDNAQAPVKAVQ